MKPKKLKFSEKHYKTNDIKVFDTLEEYNKTLEKNVLHFYLRHKKIDSLDKLIELNDRLIELLIPEDDYNSDDLIFHNRQPLCDEIILVCNGNVTIIDLRHFYETTNGYKVVLDICTYKLCKYSKDNNKLRQISIDRKTFEGVDDRMIQEILRPTKIASFLDSEEE